MTSGAETVDPTSGILEQAWPFHSSEQVEDRVRRAWEGFRQWRRIPVEERAAVVDKIADALTLRREIIAQLITKEMGKTIREAFDEVDKCVAACRYVATMGPRHVEPVRVATEDADTHVRFDPTGPVLGVMPWNFPFWQVIRFFAPAVLAGNTALLKHSEGVQGCAHALEDLVREACPTPDVLVNINVDRSTVHDLVTDRRIRGVTVTGSVQAGRAVAASAGAVGKPVVLELGGSDAFIVLADADIAGAAEAAVRSRFQNAGQSCIAAKRFIVEAPAADSFRNALERRVAALRTGDPQQESTDVGPLARDDLRAQLSAQVQDSIGAGARLVAGGHQVEGPGFFYAPTILDHVEPTHRVWREEVFGPVAPLMVVESVDHAIEEANNTTFGLGASLWTQDRALAERLVDRLDAGAVYVNATVRSDPRLPFGGIADSGYGRELGEWGTRVFTNVKTVWLA